MSPATPIAVIADIAIADNIYLLRRRYCCCRQPLFMMLLARCLIMTPLLIMPVTAMPADMRYAARC